MDDGRILGQGQGGGARCGRSAGAGAGADEDQRHPPPAPGGRPEVDGRHVRQRHAPRVGELCPLSDLRFDVDVLTLHLDEMKGAGPRRGKRDCLQR